MLSLFKSLSSKDKGKAREHYPPHNPDAPPEWQPAPEQVHAEGLYADASTADYEAAEDFCMRYPQEAPRMLSSDAVDRIRRLGSGAWRLAVPSTPRFRGVIHNGGEKGPAMGVVRVVTEHDCQDVCILSDLPILAGLYDTRGRPGVYYEIKIIRMDGVIAVGTACRPYPEWRLPGWNRLSAGLHLDDCRKFFEDPDGGRNYTPDLPAVSPGDTVGVGYSWQLGTLFYTHNGRRLPDAFSGLYLPREMHDVYAAIGVSGPGVCEFEVNFGGGSDFEWKEGNNWKVEGHVGMMPGGAGGADDELPSYSDARNDRAVTYQ
ncbi:hypothetical protein OH76DRAFT_1399366 [Lentinus brumalis]|uniref:SPRY domain-containing protein n=1 Tax=Lentinus brumalis TaxID=2498619 RepID=A0A371DLP9_9APHY|nr:hypothetical protein OH76DRAFT_1399366 [Polyporus brumalis]